MKTQDAVNKLCTHLLGKNWYITDPVNGDMANAIIVEEIVKKYPAVDESPVEKWRRKHKRCMWCSHCVGRRVMDRDLIFYTIYDCKAKGRDDVNIDIPRPFCTLFELKKEN
jgi:hypothetical protein